MTDRRDLAGPRGPIVAVPLYRNPALLTGLAAALADQAAELRAIGATVLLVDDSPDDAPLTEALAEWVPRLAAAVATELVVNPVNLGFVRSANIALARGRDERRDVILLNSDTLPRPGAFAELAAVAALDPRIGAISPRSDNATICNSPYDDALRMVERDRAYAAHRAIERHLPRVTDVPTVVGFCMYVRWTVLAEFGLFDEAYGGGYNEENDLVRRFNRRGWRAVLANHAYVHHVGQASFTLSDTPSSERDRVNAALLAERYPEYWDGVWRYFGSAEYRAQRLLGGLVAEPDGRRRLLIDARILDAGASDAADHAAALVRALGERGDRWDVHVLCGADAFAAWGLGMTPGLRCCTGKEAAARPFAAAIALGVPRDAASLATVSEAGAVYGVVVLDAAPVDRDHLDDGVVRPLAARLCATAELIGFASDALRERFTRRFHVPAEVVRFVAPCSTRIEDYRGIVLPEGLAVIGRDAADVVRALADAETVPGTIVLADHGDVAGVALLQALATGRPVAARDTPGTRAIAAACADAGRLRLGASTAALVAIATGAEDGVAPDTGSRPATDWRDAAAALADAVDEALAAFDFGRLRTRLALLPPPPPADAVITETVAESVPGGAVPPPPGLPARLWRRAFGRGR